MSELVLPNDTNPHGTAFGGRIMEWMDVAAGISASRHARRILRIYTPLWIWVRTVVGC